MAFAVDIAADSISEDGCRITTFVVTLPRIMLAELNTHRMFSRNSASSRAIPLQKQLRLLLDDTFVPSEFGTNVKGMQAGPVLEGKKLEEAERIWREAATNAIWSAMKLATSEKFIDDRWADWHYKKNGNFVGFVLEIANLIEDDGSMLYSDPSILKVQKGLLNRLLEPFMWHQVIITATEWENFFGRESILGLRTHTDAQLEIRTAAQMMKEKYDASEPVLLHEGEWHLPFIQPQEREWALANPLEARKVSAARCARVSYLTHDKKIVDISADLKLALRLDSGGHMSPFEHPATPFTKSERGVRMAMAQAARELRHTLSDNAIAELITSTEFSQNLRGFKSLRSELPHQANYADKLAELAAAA